jgi:RNA-directed DNA polymerase
VLEPILEADLSDSAFGYREGRSAGEAVKRVHRALCDGYTDVVDADLSKYFDTIPHDQLMKSVARRVSDAKMLKLIKAWLKTPVEETDERGKRRMTAGKSSRMGTSQGGVISSLLANIYMNRFLRVFLEQGKDREFAARLVNYADDFVILSRGKAEPPAPGRGESRWIGRRTVRLSCGQGSPSAVPGEVRIVDSRIPRRPTPDGAPRDDRPGRRL